MAEEILEIGQNILLYTLADRRYVGKITDVGSIFLTIYDEKTRRDYNITLTSIERVEVLSTQ